MKERGMLFSAPMVLALLDGSKTQTRRLVKHEIRGPNYLGHFNWYDKNGWQGAHGGGTPFEKTNAALLCPYGQPGDQIWVREHWRTYKALDGVPPRAIIAGAGVQYEAGGANVLGVNNADRGRFRNSMHMPRWASRIDLEITGVRVERLQDISEADTKAEGIESAFDSTRWRMYDHCDGEKHSQYVGPRWTIDPVRSYRSLWLSINGAGSWDVNPWVWVIEFKRLEQQQVFDVPTFLRKAAQDHIKSQETLK
jgi:hypothetical protein